MSRTQATVQATVQATMQSFDYNYTVCLLGNAGVGKTALMIQYLDHKFFKTSTSRDQPDIRIAHVQHAQKWIRLAINDSVGKKEYRSAMIGLMKKDTDAVVFVYDPTRRDTFVELRQWLQDVEDKFGDTIGRLLVCNKTDCADEDKKVSEEEAKKFAAEMGTPLLKTSAKTNTNVESVFHEAIASIFQSQGDNRRRAQLERSIELTRTAGQCFLGCTQCPRRTARSSCNSC